MFKLARVGSKYFKDNSILDIIFRIISNLNIRSQVTLSFSFLLFGLVLNYFFPISLFIVKSLLVLTILNIILYAIKYYVKTLRIIVIELSGDPVLSAAKIKLNDRVNSNINILISLSVGLYFVFVSILLKFVEFNLLGFFALVALLITVFVSILGYLQYIYLIEFLVNISDSSYTNYSTFYPANTKWLVITSKLVNYYQNGFFISGSMYILLFSLFTPSDTLKILTSQFKDTVIFLPLFLSWLIILIAIIVAFPITSIVKNKSIKAIVENMKYQSIREFENKMVYSKPDILLEYVGIIREIKKSDAYPFNKRNDLIIPYLTTFFNFLAVLNSLFPNIKNILNTIKLL